MLNIPQRLEPNYLLLRVVGQGAAGLVYEAYDLLEERRVAIKVLIAGGRAIPEVIERFKREADLQSRLRDYPGIVSVYAFGLGVLMSLDPLAELGNRAYQWIARNRPALGRITGKRQ